MPHPSITPFLWFDDNLEEAVGFYSGVFPDVEVHSLHRAGPTGPVVGGEFTLQGRRLMALNGGPAFRFTQAISLFVSVSDQDELDHYWAALLADGGTESECGWLQDRFGLFWQVVPASLGQFLGGPDPDGAARAQQALRRMRRIVIADLDAAYRGVTS